jgi:hypothetical protein
MRPDILSKIFIEIATGRYETNMIQRIVVKCENKKNFGFKENRNRYFSYCPNGEIFLFSIFPLQGNLQVNLHINTLKFMWIDRLEEYFESIKLDCNIIGHEVLYYHLGHIPRLKETLDSLLQIYRENPELKNACETVWGKNTYPTNIEYEQSFDVLFR